MGVQEHKKRAFKHLTIGVLSLSSTRTLAEDQSGHWIAGQAKKEGHEVVFHQVMPDDATLIGETLQDAIRDYELDAMILTGGTGLSPRDQTIEAVEPLFDKVLTAFGPLFAQLSFEQIDSAAIISRAVGGILGKTAVFCIPGSLKACKLACNELIFPELGHILKHLSEE